MKKQRTAKLDLNGQKVDVGIPTDLLADLGGMVYFGVLARLSKDKGNIEGQLSAGAAMCSFAQRYIRKVESRQGISDESYKAWAHVLEWVESSLDIESLSVDPESPELAKLAARVRVGGRV